MHGKLDACSETAVATEASNKVHVHANMCRGRLCWSRLILRAIKATWTYKTVQVVPYLEIWRGENRGFNHEAATIWWQWLISGRQVHCRAYVSKLLRLKCRFSRTTRCLSILIWCAAICSLVSICSCSFLIFFVSCLVRFCKHLDLPSPFFFKIDFSLPLRFLRLTLMTMRVTSPSTFLVLLNICDEYLSSLICT